MVDDLPGFRDFLLRGICFKVLQKKTLSWPVTPTDETPEIPRETPAKKSAKDGKETPAKKDAKGKDKVCFLCSSIWFIYVYLED